MDKNLSTEKCLLLEKELSKYKLWANLNPEKAFPLDLKRILSKEEWKILEKAVYKKQEYKCHLCIASTSKLMIHEQWFFDYNTSKQQLKDIVALCDLCYFNTHLEKKNLKKKVILHWSLVNNEQYHKFEEYKKKVWELWELRKHFNWQVEDNLGNDISRGISLYTLLKLVANGYKGEYVPQSQENDWNFTTIEDIFDQFEKSVSELEKIRIYKWNKECWKCQKETPHVSYCIAFQGEIIGCIGDIEKLDKYLLEEYPFVKDVYSKTQERRVIGNTCIHCGAYQGNYFIFDEFLHYVDDKNLDKTIQNILCHEDLPPIISLLADLEDIDDINSDDWNDPEFLYDLGLEYRDRKNYEFALRIFSQIFELNPRESDALVYIGEIYAETLEYDKALKIYNKVLKMDPENTLISEVDLILLEMEKEFRSKLYEIIETNRFEGVLIVEKNNSIYDITMGEGSGFYQVGKDCNHIISHKDTDIFELLSCVVTSTNFQINHYGTLYGKADYSININEDEVIEDRLMVVYFEKKLKNKVKKFYAEISCYDIRK